MLYAGWLQKVIFANRNVWLEYEEVIHSIIVYKKKLPIIFFFFGSVSTDKTNN